MAREGIDLYQIGNTPEELQSALIELRAEFDSHVHDGASSKNFETISADTLSAHTILIRKTAYGDSAVGIWMGIDDKDGLMKLKLGSGSQYLQWDGSTLTIAGAINATSGTIGGWTIGATTLTGGGVTLDSANGRITGGTVRTASSGSRVEMSSADAGLSIYNGSTLRMFLSGTGQAYLNSSGTTVAILSATSSSFGIVTQSSTGTIQFEVGTSGAIAFVENGTTRLLYDAVNNQFGPFTAGFLDLGASGAEWGSLFLQDIFTYQGADQPVVFFGYVDDTGSEGTPFPSGWSSTSGSTGVYTITHNLGSSTAYVPLATALKSTLGLSAKIGSRSSNSFTVRIFDDTGTLTDSDFTFAVFLTP